jgi:uncharacterized SAM-binding protein YcdF (DUF218 family)
LRRLLIPAFAGCLLWSGGFAWFVASGLLHRADPTAPTDAIVVLTGGRQRLATGLDLLAAGMAKKLFISGVNPRVDRDELLRALAPAGSRGACCIVLGHDADNTFGNAQETAHWMREEGYRSLRLVTSWYHMPRSLLEFGRAMPQTTILAHPVFAAPGESRHWWGRHGAPFLITAEYGKYLVAWLRPASQALWPARQELAPEHRITNAQRNTPGRGR